MLVLTRRKGEAILLDDPQDPGRRIHITVLENREGRVSLGITAPQEMHILRPEAHTVAQFRHQAGRR